MGANKSSRNGICSEEGCAERKFTVFRREQEMLREGKKLPVALLKFAGHGQCTRATKGPEHWDFSSRCVHRLDS